MEQTTKPGITASVRATTDTYCLPPPLSILDLPYLQLSPLLVSDLPGGMTQPSSLKGINS